MNKHKRIIDRNINFTKKEKIKVNAKLTVVTDVLLHVVVLIIAHGLFVGINFFSSLDDALKSARLALGFLLESGFLLVAFNLFSTSLLLYLREKSIIHIAKRPSIALNILSFVSFTATIISAYISFKNEENSYILIGVLLLITVGFFQVIIPIVKNKRN